MIEFLKESITLFVMEEDFVFLSSLSLVIRRDVSKHTFPKTFQDKVVILASAKFQETKFSTKVRFLFFFLIFLLYLVQYNDCKHMCFIKAPTTFADCHCAYWIRKG